jgi:sugar/nucleoside kinase (ribokinase family)
MNISILGHVCIDKNTSENASYTAAGSPAMFMDKIFRQLPEAQTVILAPYGNDFLSYKGSATLLPRQSISDKTLVYENISKNGTREQKAYNREGATPVPLDTENAKTLATTDILFIAPLLPNYSVTYLQSILAATNPHAIKVLLPQGYYRSFDQDNHVTKRTFEEAEAILPLIDIVIVSEQDQVNMKQEILSWTQKNQHLIAVMTLSEKGAVAFQGDKEIMLPVIPVPEKDIVDSVGSGDIFSAGFAYRYQQTKNIERAGSFANALARQCLFFTPNEIKLNFNALP